MCISQHTDYPIYGGEYLELTLPVSPTTTRHEVTIMIPRNAILSVLRLNLACKVKKKPLPLGDPLGFALGNSLRHRAIFDRIYLVLF